MTIILADVLRLAIIVPVHPGQGSDLAGETGEGLVYAGQAG